MARYDLLVRDCTLIDGTGRPRVAADIAIIGGVIQKIGLGLAADTAEQCIEARGAIVAPGIIDPHTHYDAQIHWDPYCTSSGWHGHTTVGVGNCGFGFAPCAADSRERYMRMMENTEQVPLDALRKGLAWNWETFPEWMERMRALPKGVNVASYLPLNSLMMYVMGYEAAKRRGATTAERGRMRDLLNEAMDVGAIGFALSHLNERNSHKDCDGTPMPTDMMHIEDAFSLAEVLRERGQGVIQCLCEIPGGGTNRATAEELARRSRRPILHNIIAPFDALPDYHRSILRWLDEMEREGLEIYSQAFCYREWSEFNVNDYNAWSHIPLFNTFSHAGDPAAKAALASDAAFLARARAEYQPMMMIGAGGPLETFIFHRGPEVMKSIEGKTLVEIAAARGVPVTDVFFGLVAESGSTAEFRTLDPVSQSPELMCEVVGHHRVVPGTSDGGAHVKFHAGGQYSTDMLMHLSRDSGLFSLEDLHHRLSAVPARVLGLEGRGTLVEGAAADLYMYDIDRLSYPYQQYEVLHDLPGGDWRRTCRPSGIEAIVVNGVQTFSQGQSTGATPGVMLGSSSAPRG
ncbi:MAG: amidohydrolase family protein [Sinimarinibacterium sp.]|jgi:N-acyl-D-aspartate/D-glutamate deacylase